MTASLPTGSDKVLEIRAANVDLIIKNKGKKIAGIAESNPQSSSLKIVALDAERISIPLQAISEEYHEHNGIAVHEIKVEPLFFEQTDYIITVRSRNHESLEFHSNSLQISERVSRVIDDDASLLTGVINFGNNVGFSDLIIYANTKRVLSIQVEVYPSKLSYKEDYQEMMADINNLISESILAFMKNTYQVFVPNHKKNDVSAVFFTILQNIYEKYLKAAKRIIAVPHHKLISEHEVVPHYKAKRVDLKSLKWLQKHTEYLKTDGDVILVDRVLSVKKRVTYDTRENQLVKFMLRSTMRLIKDFIRRYLKGCQYPSKDILDGARRMEHGLERLLADSFLADVSEYSATQSMSLVFGLAPGYRELYKFYLMLQCGITTGGDIFRMSVKDTAQLYEYWCFIKLYSILKERYELKSPDIIRVDRKGITIELVKGQPSQIEFLNTRTRESFFLSYNPTEHITQTVNQRPDNVLELKKKGSKISYKYIFDAKYRIEMNPESHFYPDKKPGPKVDDINTMHRYRDSIVFESHDTRFTFEKTMFGAYILFPYTNEKEYESHRFYQSIDSVNIGGLPFLPSATTLVTKLLDDLITDSSESAFERTTLPAGIEERIRTVDWEKRDVLIGFVPDKEHFDIFYNNRMYFTRRFNKDNLPIRYIALYEKGSGICYYGEFLNWHKEERRTLPGKSNHPTELYHVFDVKEWVPLPDIIKTEETGPNPIAYTNFFLLRTSKKYSELRLRSEADYRFFVELKRRTDTKILDEENNTVAFEVGDSKIWLKNNQICVFRNGEQVKSCTIDEFNKRPNATFRKLQNFIGI